MSQSRPSAFDPGYSNDPEPQLQVVVHAGPLAGKGFPITADEVTFGRDPENSISWDDGQVSRFHARLRRQGHQLILEDLDSTNGTLVNGKPVEGEHVLQPADIITIGTSIFGVKGFSAPNTIGVTQISRDRLTLPPSLARSASPRSQPSASPQSGSAPTSRAQGSGMNMLVISGILALVVIVVAVAAVSAYFLFQDQGTSVAQIPKVVITAPVPGSEVSINQPVTVQATASDPSGVVRMELWVDGVKTAEAVSPVQQGQPTLTASLQWVPTTIGNHTLEVKAYNQSSQVSDPTAVVVAAVDGSGSDTASPTPTFTPETPTATVPSSPFLTTKTDLNVRAGPDTSYDLLGLLPSGTDAEILGRDEARQWWQIRFSPSPTGIGWVAADPEFSTTYNVDSLPISAAPPTPTGTPTSTPTGAPTPTTIPPTETPAPPTNTPIPTETPTPPGAQVVFEVSPRTIQGGQCVEVSWNVANVREVYYQGEGVAGVGDRTECPRETTVYRLRIVRQDGTEQVEDRRVEVINPITSSGTLTLEPNETLDLDEGEIPGDDFEWIINDRVRQFEVRNEARLAVMGQFDSLDEVSLNDCANADFDDFTYVDASDVIEDTANALKDGLVICYRTDENRLGKLRFPRYSTNDLTIRWVTW